MEDHDGHYFDRYLSFDFKGYERVFRTISKCFYKNKKVIKTYKCKTCGIKCYYTIYSNNLYYFHDKYVIYGEPIKCTEFQIKQLLE